MSDATRNLRQYHDEKVKPDAMESQIKREMATGVIEQVRSSIPNAGNVQYTGSQYEGNATRGASDFDVMIDVAPKGSSFQYEKTDAPGFGKLKYQSGADDGYTGKVVTGDGYLSGKNVIEKQVQPAVDKLIGVQNHGGHLNVNGREIDVKRSVHGPAITLDLKSGKHETQVDIVPTVGPEHVTGGKEGVSFVAKPSSNATGSRRETEWRQSTAVQEKETFKGVHHGNQVHSEVLKDAKTARAENPALQSMPSYVAKTAQMSLIAKDEQRVSQGSQPKSWSPAESADRLQDLGKELYQGLDRGDMRNPHNPAMNVLSKTTAADRQEWKQQIGADGKGLVNLATTEPKK
ncbi:cyclic GMP-AMP synthase-like receptor 3 [Watersipora subatra]|uniref:cyclic GMP-AMP synthase-like receptor 3 n=1 Tax=Watersipora subatra TaxID=2589382 RepID=UPI00355B64CF